MSYLQEFTTPNFLLCENPIKKGGSEDNRVWVYCVKNLTLIECICLNDVSGIRLNVKYKSFKYENEQWALAFVQNNAEATDGNEDEILDSAWHFFENYLKWEDRNIESDVISKLN